MDRRTDGRTEHGMQCVMSRAMGKLQSAVILIILLINR